MRGEVHDENAFALGGAAGHAGLFGTIDGVLDAAQRLLAGRRSVACRAADAAIGNAMPGLGSAPRGLVRRRRLLRRRPSATPVSPAPAYGSISSAGCAWALLTNRVHPTRHRDTGIDALRRRVGDLIIGAAA